MIWLISDVHYSTILTKLNLKVTFALNFSSYWYYIVYIYYDFVIDVLFSKILSNLALVIMI